MRHIQESLTSGGGPPPHPKTVKTRKPFSDYIRVREHAAEILALLHGWIDRTEKVKALVYIKAAMEARVLDRPPYEVAAAEFPGRLGGKSLYYAYTSEPMSFTEEDCAVLYEARDTLISRTKSHNDEPVFVEFHKSP